MTFRRRRRSAVLRMLYNRLLAYVRFSLAIDLGLCGVRRVEGDGSGLDYAGVWPTRYDGL